MKNLEDILTRIGEIQTELKELNERLNDEDELTGDDVADEDKNGEARFTELSDEFTELETRRVEIVERNEKIEAIHVAAKDPRNVVSNSSALPVPVESDPFDLSDMRFDTTPSEMRARALSAVEGVVDVPDSAKEEMTRKLEHVSDSRGVIPQLILHTSSEVYRSAWAKAMGGKENLWSPEEAAAVERVDSFRTAFGLTESGYAAPAVIDPSVILTGLGSTNPFRVVSRVETIVTNSWKPITSGGISGSWTAEATEVSDDTPSFGQPEITVRKAQAFAFGSIEAVNDWAEIGAELGREFADAKDQLEAIAFATGTGTNQPIGITKALDGVPDPVELAPATAEVYAVADVYKCVKSVPPSARGPGSNVAVLMNLGTIMKTRQFSTTQGSSFLVDLGAGTPARLLGYPLYEASTMRDYDDLDTEASADNFLIVAGDWTKYVIVDRIGLSVEFIPLLMGSSKRPTGERGWYAYWRVGADSILDTAFSMLSIPTT